MTNIIEVIISPTGDSRIETRGFTGNSCRQASQFLEQALGIRTNEKLTEEFYQQEVAQHQIQQGGVS